MADPDSTPAVLVTCEECGKRYRVPATGRSFRCKECGAPLRAPDPAAAAAAAAAAAPLPPSAEERRAAARELGKAYRVMRQMRFLYSALAFLQGFFALLLLSQVGLALSGRGDLADVPRGVLYAAIGIQLGVTALLVTAAVRVVREPFVWALVVALLQTLSVVLALMQGGAGFVQYGLAVLLWGALVPLVGVRARVREHPDLYVARRVRGEAHLRPEEGVETVRGRAQERRKAEAAARRTTWIAVGGTLAALAALFVGWKVLNRPPELSEVTPGLVEAWNRSDLAAVGAYWERPERAEALLEQLIARRGWEGLPPIERDELSAGDRPRQRAHTSEGVFELRWRLEGRRWILSAIDPP